MLLKKCQNKRLRKALLAGSVFLASFFVSCKSSTKPLIIWTDKPEIVSYVELFNLTHKDAKAVVIYKEQPARSLPPVKDEYQPDILIGSWLKNSSTRKFFTPLDYIFLDNKISKSDFYSTILNYGVINEKQYLLPVSFNLPSVIFSKKNESLIGTDHMLNLEQLKTVAGNFNTKNKAGNYSAIGYAPSWDPDFIYAASKLNNASYREKGISFSWDSAGIQKTISSLKDWTVARNTDTTSEQNFQFRYLYMPKYRQVTTDRCLFAFSTSEELFGFSENQGGDLSFRWLEQNDKIPVEDDIVTLGMYKNTKNAKSAEVFISWFFKEDTQKKLLERTHSTKSDTKVFGIADGFSAIKGMNETVYPTYYRNLLGNFPGENYFVLPYILPYRWNSLKQKVILPYLSESIITDSQKSIDTLETRIAEWSKQFY